MCVDASKLHALDR